jgi:hypothetical protein
MSWRTFAWGCLGLTAASCLLLGWVALGVCMAAAGVMAEIGASQWP